MKKILAIILALVMVSGLCANVFADDEEQADGSASRLAVSDVFEFSASEEQNISDTVFPEPVTVRGEGGGITFFNCFFVFDVVNEGIEGTNVRMINCRFAQDAKCVIRNDIQNASMETSMPKFLMIGSEAEIICDNVGAAVALQDTDLFINGEWHGIESCDLFIDSATGEITPYAGQADEREDLAHNYCMWTENGEPVHAHVATPAN